MDQKNCKICLQPKEIEGSGSLTEWFAVCQCQDKGSEEELFTSLRICTNCKKKINVGRQGSFTQWIFRSALCNCEKPTIASSPEEKTDSAPSFKTIDYPELTDIQVDFPSDRYKPIEEIGRGARGIVYRSQDRLLGKVVAVKILQNLDPSLIVSFQEEAKITASLNHPNIVKIIDINITDSGTPYMVLEYVIGVSLSSYLALNIEVGWEQAVELFLQICSAIEYSHKNGILHRDIQPSNILLTRDLENQLQIKIIDFGLSKIWQLEENRIEYHGTTIVGTPGYMSPDQANGLPFDTTSDIYSLGSVLFELVSGKRPFEGDSALEILNNQLSNGSNGLEASIIELDAPRRLKEVIGKCLKIKPDDRYESVQKLVADLLNCLNKNEAVSSEHEDGRVEKEGTNSPDTTTKIINFGPGSLFVLGGIIVLFGIVLFQVFVSNSEIEQPSTLKQMSESEKKIAQEKLIFAPLKSLDEKDLGAISPAKGIEGLYRSNYFINDSNLKKFKNRNEIRRLDLSRSQVQGKGLRYLKMMPLVSLGLNKRPITDQDLLPLTESKTLKRLFLIDTKVTGKYMDRFKHVDQLYAYRCPLDEEGMKAISRMPNLEVLAVSSDLITPNWFSYLAMNSPLGVLVLDGKGELAEKLPKIAKIKNLFNLQFQRRHIFKKDLRVAKRMGLKTFLLRTCTLEDGCLEVISQMKTLTTLTFIDTDVSLPMREKLKKRLPDCNIEYKKWGRKSPFQSR